MSSVSVEEDRIQKSGSRNSAWKRRGKSTFKIFTGGGCGSITGLSIRSSLSTSISVVSGPSERGKGVGAIGTMAVELAAVVWNRI
jgi:hypothetical protein